MRKKHLLIHLDVSDSDLAMITNLMAKDGYELNMKLASCFLGFGVKYTLSIEY